MKKIISVIMVVLILLSFGSGVFANILALEESEVKKRIDTDLTDFYIKTDFNELKSSTKVSTDLKDIPIYITTSIELSNKLNKEDISGVIDEHLKNKHLLDEYKYNYSTDSDRGNESLLNIENPNYRIEELSLTKREDIYTNPLFSDTLARAQEMIEGGADVKYIIFYVRDQRGVGTNNINDPDYWLYHTSHLCTYNGYNFRFLESTIYFESSEVTENNIGSHTTWPRIIGATVRSAIDAFSSGAVATINTTFGIIEHFTGAIVTPLNVTYSQLTDFIKYSVSGNIYLRTIVISDNQNRIPGYAYYPWATAEEAGISLRVRMNYPVRKRAGGTYDYEENTKYSERRYLATPAFYGNRRDVFLNIIDLYNNKSGYFTHNEYLDMDRIIYNTILR